MAHCFLACLLVLVVSTVVLADWESERSDGAKRSSNWSVMRGTWGKRDWKSAKGMWGKRAPMDEVQDQDEVAKRNWNRASGMWGKRYDADEADQDDKRGWQKAMGMWGKRTGWNSAKGMWGRRKRDAITNILRSV